MRGPLFTRSSLVAGQPARPECLIIDMAEERCVPSKGGVRLSEINGARIPRSAGALLLHPATEIRSRP